MKWISIYMTLMILFSINFRSVCVGGDKDKQNTGHGAAQGCCNEEKKVQKQKEDTEDMQEPEKGTKNLDVKHLTVPREQMTDDMSKYEDDSYYRFMDIYTLYEEDFIYNDYFYDGRDIDENFECCNCCEIM